MSDRTPEQMSVVWLPVSDSRPNGGRYVLVCNKPSKKVGFARYKPLKGQWVFPSANMAFEVTHFMHLPEAAS